VQCAWQDASTRTGRGPTCLHSWLRCVSIGRFFKQAKDADYLRRTILAGLPPLPQRCMEIRMVSHGVQQCLSRGTCSAEQRGAQLDCGMRALEACWAACSSTAWSSMLRASHDVRISQCATPRVEHALVCCVLCRARGVLLRWRLRTTVPPWPATFPISQMWLSGTLDAQSPQMMRSRGSRAGALLGKTHRLLGAQQKLLSPAAVVISMNSSNSSRSPHSNSRFHAPQGKL
jgi:hypothetical protein